MDTYRFSTSWPRVPPDGRDALSSLPDGGGQACGSARLITRGKEAWTYRFFQVRAGMPSGTGTWPAIRMLGAACTAFHDWQLHWTADEVAIGVNGSLHHRHRNPRSGRAAWPFDASQYLLLNIAIGGTLGGVVDDTIFPRTMEIEHVRVWQLRR